jgi:hypothetical protein
MKAAHLPAMVRHFTKIMSVVVPFAPGQWTLLGKLQESDFACFP